MSGASPNGAARAASEFVNLGMMTREGVAELYFSPEFQNMMKDQIRSQFMSGASPNGAARAASEFVNLGMMMRENAQGFLTALGVR